MTDHPMEERDYQWQRTENYLAIGLNSIICVLLSLLFFFFALAVFPPLKFPYCCCLEQQTPLPQYGAAT